MEIVITRKKDLEAKKHSADAEVSSLRTTNLAGEFTTLLLSFSQIRNFRRLRKELTLSTPFSICWKADAQHWPARSEKYLPRTKRSQEHLTTSKKKTKKADKSGERLPPEPCEAENRSSKLLCSTRTVAYRSPTPLHFFWFHRLSITLEQDPCQVAQKRYVGFG